MAAMSLIETIGRTRAELERDPALRARLLELQHWQVERLKRTYEDFQRQPRYRDAIEFFIGDLYGPHDFRQRDRDLKKVLQSWQRLLPQHGLDAIARALELELLTQALDLALLEALGAAPLSKSSYAEAYRAINRRKDREHQVELIVSSGRLLDTLVHHAWVRSMLRLARTPARLAGVTTLHDFLERGCAAFAKMQGADTLLQAIERRERAIIARLFDGTEAPFEVA